LLVLLSSLCQHFFALLLRVDCVPMLVGVVILEPLFLLFSELHILNPLFLVDDEYADDGEYGYSIEACEGNRKNEPVVVQRVLHLY
jgi:hypothetical protein